MTPEQLQAIRERVNQAKAEYGVRLSKLLNDGHTVAQFYECDEGHKFYCDLEDNEPDMCPVCGGNAEFGESFVIVPQTEFIPNAHVDIPALLDKIERLTPNSVGITGDFDGVTDTRKITMDLSKYDDLLTKIERLRGALEIANDCLFGNTHGDKVLEEAYQVISQALAGDSHDN